MARWKASHRASKVDLRAEIRAKHVAFLERTNSLRNGPAGDDPAIDVHAVIRAHSQPIVDRIDAGEPIRVRGWQLRRWVSDARGDFYVVDADGSFREVSREEF